jgi:hypothetical protein
MPGDSARQKRLRVVTLTVDDRPLAVTTSQLAARRRGQKLPLVCCCMRRSSIIVVMVYGALASFTASTAWAQCRPPHNSNEAKLLAFYSVPIVFSADPASLSLPSGAIRLSVEGALVPAASAELQQTDYCYTGRAENTSLTRFFGRPRLAIGLPGGFGAEVSYLPSITVASATPNLGSGAIWLTRAVSSGMLLTGRLHGTVGTVKGPITCPENALQQDDSEAPCYGTAPSTDQFSPNMAGAELIASTNPASGQRLRFSAGIGANRLYPRFKVGFSDLSGGTDHTRIAVDLTRITGLAGATYILPHGCDVSAQAFNSFTDATTVRATLGCLLKH